MKTNPGYYGFQLVHSRLPSLRFATSDKLLARQFMKVLSKGSVQRDWSYDPYSSSQIATVSLEEAQTMHPPPRPPAPPASRSAIQKSARAPHLPVLSMDTGHGTTPSIPEDGVASQSVTPRDHNSTLAASPTTRFSSIRSRGSERLSRIKKRASLSL